MHFVIVHNFAHRLRNDGILESAPVKLFGLPADPVENKDIIVKAGTWERRSPDECGLSGADYQSVVKNLQFMKHQMPSPFNAMSSEPQKEQIVDPTSIR